MYQHNNAIWLFYSWVIQGHSVREILLYIVGGMAVVWIVVRVGFQIRKDKSEADFVVGNNDRQPEQRYVSPDGKLILVAYYDPSKDDWTVGFEGSEWHTHGDVLAPTFGKTDEEAVCGFIQAILTDQLVVGVLPVEGMPDQIYVSDAPDKELEQERRPNNLVLRYWSGREYLVNNGMPQK